MTLPIIFTWPYALPFWLLYALVVVPELILERHSNETREAHRAQDRGSVRILHVTGHTAFWLALASAVFIPAASATVGRDVVFLTGLGLLSAGGLLRNHCFRMLGPLFSGTVRVEEGQPIVQRGAYRWIRHPSYTGGMMISIGIGLALTNWLSAGLMALGSAGGYVFRVRAEERALLETLGEPYRAYMERTKRFLPFIL